MRLSSESLDPTIKVLELAVIGPHRLEITFSNGSRDAIALHGDMLSRGDLAKAEAAE